MHDPGATWAIPWTGPRSGEFLALASGVLGAARAEALARPRSWRGPDAPLRDVLDLP